MRRRENPAIFGNMNRAEFMSEIEAFLLDHSMSAREFGRRAMGDPSFVYECRGGRSPRLDTVAVVMRFMGRFMPKQRPAA